MEPPPSRLTASSSPEDVHDGRALFEARPDAVARPAAVHRDEEQVAARRDAGERARVAPVAEAVVELRVLRLDEALGVGGDLGGPAAQRAADHR